MELNENQMLESFMAIHSFLQDGINLARAGGEVKCKVKVVPGYDEFTTVISIRVNTNAFATIEYDLLPGYHFPTLLKSNEIQFSWNDGTKELKIKNRIYTLYFKRS